MTGDLCERSYFCRCTVQWAFRASVLVMEDPLELTKVGVIFLSLKTL